MARSQQDEEQGLEQAGFERLYLAVQSLLKPALAYKQRKPAELQLHHIEEVILSPLTQTLEQAATQLRQRIEEQTLVLQGAVQALTEGTWRRVVPQLPEVLEKTCRPARCCRCAYRTWPELERGVCGVKPDYPGEFPVDAARRADTESACAYWL